MPDKTYDYIVIGSGFGGSVSAMRLAEKGYSVLLLEEGKEWKDDDFPKRNNNFFRYYWFPRIFCRGFQKIHFFRHTAILGACGVGGGSLVYANTLLKPGSEFFNSSDFPKGWDWQKELDSFYEVGSFMLGKTSNRQTTEMDRILKDAADKIGRGETHYYVDVGVFFGEPDKTVPDPYFNGEGPSRTGCTLCAGCMIGCRVGSKNFLPKNYLYFASKFGAEIVPERSVYDIIKNNGCYEVFARKATSPFFTGKYRYKGKKIILSAGVIGSLKLLFKLKRRNRIKISETLGLNVRTNSESLIGVRKTGRKINFAEGVAITSGAYIDDKTHVEVVRYPKGANALSVITTLLTDKHRGIYRPLTMFANIARHPWRLLRALNPVGWAKESIILLVMQTEDNRIKLSGRRTLFGGEKLVSGLEHGRKKAPVYIPQANNLAKIIAKNIGGIPLSCIYEVFFDTPLTAHILGGCKIGDSEMTGVVDSEQKLFGYDDFYVADASTIPANLGVNPALTIVAMTERIMDKIPPKYGAKLKRTGIEKVKNSN